MFSNLLAYKVADPSTFTIGANNVILNRSCLVENTSNVNALKVYIGHGCKIMNEDGLISMTNGCIIGDNVKLKPYVFKKGQDVYAELTLKGPLMIGNNSTVRAKKIGPNVIIGEGCIIGEGSIINPNTVILDRSVVPPSSTIPSGCVFGGEPARFVKILSEEMQVQIGNQILMKYDEIEHDLIHVHGLKTPPSKQKPQA